jgi:phosphoglycerate kinase
MKSVTEIGSLKGKKVLVRVDWNVAFTVDGKIADDFRIQKSMQTLEYLKSSGAEVIIATHLEKGDFEALKPFVPEGMKLLSNLRSDPGEEANSPEFAKGLASQADIYVNEAFSVSHRKHASIVSVPKLLPSYAGLWFTQEIAKLSTVFYPKHPFLFILGGAKFETKLPLLKKFINIADFIFVGGALAHNFFKELGKDIGDSLVSEGNFDLPNMYESGKVMLPEDSIIENNKILDAGALTIEKLKQKISEANLVLWNGPLGDYEHGYKVSTLELAKAMANSKAESIIGGGDTIAAIQELDLMPRFSFVSSGGGAMLDFLANGTLPGIEALN